MDDDESNLGWRIVLKEMLNADEFTSILKKTTGESAVDFEEILDEQHKEPVMQLVKAAKKILGGNAIEKETLDHLLSEVGIDPYSSAIEQLINRLSDRDNERADASVRNIPITVTTIQRSKGLAADFVFITYFDDQYFLRDRDNTVVSDHDTCSFLVALTRARKKVYLVSSRKQIPRFLGWIDKRRY
jgi:superfamily I DNA/RNA helicase